MNYPINPNDYSADKLKGMRLDDIHDISDRWSEYHDTKAGRALLDRISAELHSRGLKMPA